MAGCRINLCYEELVMARTCRLTVCGRPIVTSNGCSSKGGGSGVYSFEEPIVFVQV